MALVCLLTQNRVRATRRTRGHNVDSGPTPHKQCLASITMSSLVCNSTLVLFAADMTPKDVALHSSVTVHISWLSGP